MLSLAFILSKWHNQTKSLVNVDNKNSPHLISIENSISKEKNEHKVMRVSWVFGMSNVGFEGFLTSKYYTFFGKNSGV